MITRKSTEFYSRQQTFVFVHPEADINPDTNLPYDKEDCVVVDLVDVLTCGVPMKDDTNFEFYAVLQPGEKI